MKVKGGGCGRLKSRIEGLGTRGGWRVASKVKGGHFGRLESRIESWGTVGG